MEGASSRDWQARIVAQRRNHGAEFEPHCSVRAGPDPFASARAQDSPANSPSLGDLARQAQKDKDKGKTNKPTAKLLTNDDLPSGSGGASATLGGGLGQTAQATSGGKTGADPSPAEKLAMLEAVVDRVEGLDRATLVRNVLNSNDI